MKVCTNEGKCHCQDGFDPKDSCSSGERNVFFFPDKEICQESDHHRELHELKHIYKLTRLFPGKK